MRALHHLALDILGSSMYSSRVSLQEIMDNVTIYIQRRCINCCVTKNFCIENVDMETGDLHIHINKMYDVNVMLLVKREVKFLG